MTVKKKVPNKPTPKSGTMPINKEVVEATYIDGTGKVHATDPGRITADLALGRLKIVEKFAVIKVEGEYNAELRYRAK